LEDDEFEEDGAFASFAAPQAPFHTIEGLLVVRNKLSYRISRVLEDTENRNLPILNEARLVEILSNRIVALYNNRIGAYQLVYATIPTPARDALSLRRLKLATADRDESGLSGYCEIFPRSFVCMQCGDFQVPQFLDRFDPRKCRRTGCSGRYEQVSVVRFCENCGRVERMYYHCKNDRNHPIVLSRAQKDLLRTWKFKCRICATEQMDILGLKCNHKEPSTMQPTSGLSEVKFKPLTIKEGGVFTPVVVTNIDIPDTTPPIEIEDVEFLLLGLYLGKFAFVSEHPSEALSAIRERLHTFDNPAALDVIIKTNPEYAALDAVQRRIRLAKALEIDRIRAVLQGLKRKFETADITSLNDFLALKGYFGGGFPAKPFLSFIAAQRDETKGAVLASRFADLKDRFWIRDISYIDDVTLISSCVGIINGINKFYQPGFVPHFEPLWDHNQDRARFHAVVYPFQTEGILIELDHARILSFLAREALVPEPGGSSYSEPALTDFKREDPAYKLVETILHTVCHAMIRKSTLRTGLDEDSLGELLFPSAGAFFIFSRSNINTGGLGFVFENSLFSWFEDTKSGLDSCTFDPVCIHETGACFACLYLPEHVCTKFNQSLDRDIFAGKHRYRSRVW